MNKTKLAIAVLAVLLTVSLSALAFRLIYIKVNENKRSTVIVPDNYIGESTENESTAEQTASQSNEASAQEAQIIMFLEPVTAEPMFAPKAAAEPELAAETEIEAPADSTLVEEPATSQPEKETVTAPVLELYSEKPDDNEPFEVSNMFPGDSVTKYFAIKVNHTSEVTLMFGAEVTKQTRSLSRALCIKVTQLNTGKVIYDGALSNADSEGYGVTFAQSETGETLAYYKIEAYLPSSTGNEYQNASLSASFKWFVTDKDTLGPSISTGDSTGIYIWTAIAGISLLLILLLSKKRRESEDENEI